MDFIIELAREEDAAEIYQLMRTVYDTLDDKTLFVCDDYEYVSCQLNESENNGFGVVAREPTGKIVGSFLIRYPGISGDDLGWDVGLPVSALRNVVHMESVVVHPEYRGYGLMLQMLEYAERKVEHNRFSYLLAAVSPNNPYSYNIFEQKGYRKVCEKVKYGGYLRRIYMKEVKVYE